MSVSDLAAPALPSHGARAASSAFEVGVAIPAADANIAAPCEYIRFGCMSVGASNYDSAANSLGN